MLTGQSIKNDLNHLFSQRLFPHQGGLGNHSVYFIEDAAFRLFFTRASSAFFRSRRPERNLPILRYGG